MAHGMANIGWGRFSSRGSRPASSTSTSLTRRSQPGRTALACQPNPKQADIDVILDPKNIPKQLQDRDIPQWPRDPVECRARLQALVDRELPRLRALEETLRTQYEEPARAEAKVMALASVTREEMQLLRAEQIHEQSYQRATAALLKARQQTAAPRERAAAAAVRDDPGLLAFPIVAAPETPGPTSPKTEDLNGALTGDSDDGLRRIAIEQMPDRETLKKLVSRHETPDHWPEGDEVRGTAP